MRISKKELFEISLKVLTKHSVPEDQARIIADTVVYAHASGKGTHGATRLGVYVSKIKSGFMRPDTILSKISEKGAIGVYDAGHGFGQVAAFRAVEKAIEKSIVHGVGISSVRHSNNFGTASYFAKQATEQNKIALIFSNAAPAIAPWGGSRPLFGTNPVAFGFPTPTDTSPIILDMAVSNAARGKIRLAEKNGEKIPFGWALDPDGNPTDDPTLAILGSMLPIGEHKGAGLAIVVDLLAGLLTGSGFAGRVKPLNTLNDYSDNGHLFLVLDATFFMDIESYYERMNFLRVTVKENNLKNEILLPGERSYSNERRYTETVEISDNIYQEIKYLL
ncbi:Ldh family oxidoreductase [Pleomorphovibrio marinus]|uniref:Ldh family oxidoreductase n=1 Tax=Pleomorphovibrio marinus TaxID=2164132 RepID=UPI000E0BD49C|nr:Ldh family oxidoreductase [Pleomorphovibrio marinus]